MRLYLIGLMTLMLAACGGDDAASQAAGEGTASSGTEGYFSVRDSLGGGFDSDSPRARVGWAQPTMIDLRAQDGRISVDGRKMPDTGSATTTELGFNNTSYSMTVDIEGQPRSVNCKPDDPEEGRFERTALTENRISGEFRVVFVRCTDGQTGQAIEVPGLPVTVTGSFEDLSLSH